jgi:hypothetical protein
VAGRKAKRAPRRKAAASPGAAVVRSWNDPLGRWAFVSVRVAAEAGAASANNPAGDVEYTVSTPRQDEDGRPKTAAQIKTDLSAELEVARGLQRPAPRRSLAGMAPGAAFV